MKALIFFKHLEGFQVPNDCRPAIHDYDLLEDRMKDWGYITEFLIVDDDFFIEVPKELK